MLTVAVTPENEEFNSDSTTGRTRVFYNPETGTIVEADISINPRPQADDGTALQFSTDGTPGTYDLEATFTHEIGHLLGLDHSAVLGSTMQSRQAFNGTFGLPALTERTLSEDDRQKVRGLYGPGPTVWAVLKAGSLTTARRRCAVAFEWREHLGRERRNRSRDGERRYC